MIGTIAGRELKSLFLSPLAWVILAVVKLLLAYLFLGHLQTFMQVEPRLAGMEGAPGVTDIVVAPLLSTAGVILLFVMPLLTMRLVSEERRAGTLPLLYSAPVSMTQIVLGKYLGIMGMLLAMVALITLMPLSLYAGTTLDAGKLLAGILAILLLLGAFAAAGLFMSSLTQQPTLAAIGTLGLLLLLWVIDWAGSQVGESTSGVLEYLSLLRHHESLAKGVVKTADVAYYVLFIVTFLVLAVRRLDADRLRG